jgi:hypothetical protein
MIVSRGHPPGAAPPLSGGLVVTSIGSDTSSVIPPEDPSSEPLDDASSDVDASIEPLELPPELPELPELPPELPEVLELPELPELPPDDPASAGVEPESPELPQAMAIADAQIIHEPRWVHPRVVDRFSDWVSYDLLTASSRGRERLDVR